MRPQGKQEEEKVMAKPVPHRAVLKSLPSGEIAIETGADGVWLRFDCDCLDALPYCKAACCGIHGIDVTEEEAKQTLTVNDNGKRKTIPLAVLTSTSEEDGRGMTRSSDGFCHCLDRTTRLCTIYKDRPETCRDFHCTKGPGVRGWRLDFERQLSHQ